MEVLISNKTLADIKIKIEDFAPERGGIIGIKNGVINSFYFDSAAVLNSDSNTYVPTADALSDIIDCWENTQGINFCGFVHSHPSNRNCPSPSDVEYSVEILKVFNNLQYLLLGITGGNNSFGLKIYAVYRNKKYEECSIRRFYEY